MVKPSPRLAKVRAVFPSSSRDESRRIGEILRKETVGGILLVSLAAIALLWANSPWAESYFALRDFEIGYEPWHLRLSLGAWAADGLLAIFFFLVGLELKREFVAGDLRRFSTAVVPIVAAVGGVIVPAVIYLAVVAGSPEAAHGWAIPTATDIAFAVAVLAIIGSHLPSALRIFLLTLAVVDDLIAIGIIALFYTETIEVLPLVLALAVIAVYGVIAQRYRDFFHLRPTAAWLILLPIGLVAWALVHASGVHATIAGVLLGFTIPVLHKKADRGPDSGPGLAEVFEHRFRPLSAGFAVPVFAFFSAGVAIGGGEGFVSAFTDPVVVGIVVALVVGKPLGITAATWIITRIRRINLDPSLRWMDIVGVGLLAGIGFTVSLLVAELSFAAGSEHHDHAKVAILTASVVAALAASVLLGIRNRRYRRLDAADADS
ncbi:Na+/H+ antiporter NhaA [Microbacterium aurugineum]|uniref:Na+/H+ antiporter NhaA n=1 Tax=Microbacterium aurugineum TaxID=2851642 RepID=UPI0039BE921D